MAIFHQISERMRRWYNIEFEQNKNYCDGIIAFNVKEPTYKSNECFRQWDSGDEREQSARQKTPINCNM